MDLTEEQKQMMRDMENGSSDQNVSVEKQVDEKSESKKLDKTTKPIKKSSRNSKKTTRKKDEDSDVSRIESTKFPEKTIHYFPEDIYEKMKNELVDCPSARNLYQYQVMLVVILASNPDWFNDPCIVNLFKINDNFRKTCNEYMKKKREENQLREDVKKIYEMLKTQNEMLMVAEYASVLNAGSEAGAIDTSTDVGMFPSVVLDIEGDKFFNSWINHMKQVIKNVDKFEHSNR